jgi:hypothetical protein
MAPVVLGLAVLLVGGEVLGAMRHDTDIVVLLGDDHSEIVEARLSYVLDGEEMQGARFEFAEGAPDRVYHHASLPGGRYDVEIELRTHDEVRAETRALDVPADGRVRLDLAEPGSER